MDVFFVISGYLITTLLVDDIEQKKFSLLKFYERRARRILPALFFIMLLCIPFAWMWMLPSQFEDFSKSLVATSFFASNILFGQNKGYFASETAEEPLLHTWSFPDLSVPGLALWKKSPVLADGCTGCSQSAAW